MKKILSINVPLLKHMLIKGVENLAKKYKYIDELNVFPVPDGDTGTNMKITLEGGIDSVKEIDFEDLFMFGKNFNRGLLMNARGNSGVITSQIFKGFFKTIPESKKEINIEDIVECFKGAKEIAYKAVMNPVEGTILTVIRVISEVLLRNKNNIKTIDELMDMVVVTAEETLSTTPNILPELKEAGVVDSGGYGLCRILEGMNEALDQEIGKDVIENKEKNPPISQNKINNEKQQKFIDNNEGFGYCNEFIMTLGSKVELNQGNKTKFDLSYFKSQLNKMGDSIVTVVDDNIVKVHIHSPSPWKIFDFASKYGEFNKVKVENMTLQFLERNPGTTLESMNEKINDNNAFKNISNKPKIIVTVPSKKTAELFDEKFDITNFIRTDIVGNPSVDIFFKEFKKTNSSKIILILDDSNYLLSAQKAKELLPKNVCVEIYNTRSVANSYYLALLFNHEASYKENIKTLWKEIKSANVLKISKSIKDGIFNSIKVKRGQYIGIMDKKIINANFDLLSLTADTIKKMTGRSKKFDDILVFGGDETTKAQFKELKEFLEKEYKVDNLEIYDTDIQNYPFIIAFIE